MKHVFILSVLMSSVLLLTKGCKSDGTSAASDATLPTVTVERNVGTDSTLQCKFAVDYPTGDDSLSLAVCDFVRGELANNYLPLLYDLDSKDKYPLYDGVADKSEAVVDYYADGTLSYLKQTVKEMLDAGMDRQPAVSYELSIAKIADTQRYVNYEVKSYSYLGGAHGSATDYVVNIAKPSGKVLTQTVDTLQLKALQPILRKGVTAYLNKGGMEKVSEKDLNDHLFVDNGVIPMPAHAPYLAADGVHFIYQQYEIGPYAIGMVSFTVPYAEIKQYLTKEALQLVE